MNETNLPEFPDPLAVLERTWRGSWFVREDGLDPSVPLHHLYTADQMRAYGEQCRAASVASGEVDDLIDELESMGEQEYDAGCCNANYPIAAATRCMRDAAKLLRALSRGVPEGDDSLPRPLWPVSKEWYRLCERRFAVDRITISGKLAEAIVDAVCGPAIAAQRKEGG